MFSKVDQVQFHLPKSIGLLLLPHLVDEVSEKKRSLHNVECSTKFEPEKVFFSFFLKKKKKSDPFFITCALAPDDVIEVAATVQFVPFQGEAGPKAHQEQ